MRFSIQRETLLKPLQRVVGTVDKRPMHKPILSNILVTVKSQLLSLVGTDLEVELIARIPLSETAEEGEITVGAKKLIDICRALPENAVMSFSFSEGKLSLKAHRGRYSFACLPAADFPQIEQCAADIEISMSQAILRQLLTACTFALSQTLDSARHYLNGICFSFDEEGLRVTATDGHRLATMKVAYHCNIQTPVEIIVPKKAVFEMQRLFAEGEEEVGIVIGKNHLRTITTGYSFVTKLIEGKFPNYTTIMPDGNGKKAVVNRENIKSALLRVSALLSEKQRGVRLLFAHNLLRLIAISADKDEGVEEIEIEYDGEETEIGFNVGYLLDYLSAMPAKEVTITFTDPMNSVLLESDWTGGSYQQPHLYVVMPMRI